MTDNGFDDIIRRKLEAHKTSVKPDWDGFQKARKNLDDQAFDKLVYSKLSGFSSTSGSGQWQAFQNRHGHVIQLQKHIRSVKLLEALSLLLLLFFFAGLNDFISTESRDSYAAHQLQSIDENIDLSTMPAPESISNAMASIDDSHERSSSALEKKSGFRLEDQYTDASPTSDLNYQIPVVQSPDNNLAVQVSEPKLRIKEETGSLEAVERAFFALDANEIQPLFMESREVPKILNHTQEPENNYITESFEIRPLTQPLRKAIHFYSAFDNNLIFTPDDLAYNTNSRTTEMYGFTVGALYSVKKNSLEFASGLLYSSYDKPWNFTLQYGNTNGWYSFVMTNIHYDILVLPLQLKHHFIENADWSIYLLGGLSHEFIVASNFERANNYLGGGAIPIGGGNNPPEDVMSPFELERTFNKGLFQGGNTSENYFMRGLVGAGIQRNISTEVAVYFTASYYRSIYNTSIGPNNDRLDKYSLVFGFKKNL